MSIEQNTKLLMEAARMGNAVEVMRLIPLSDPKANDSGALICAASEGHTECVKLLIPVSSPKSSALHLAAAKGNTECISLLLPLFDLKAKSEALVWATAKGQTAYLKMLIPVSDPKADNSYALQKAVANAHQLCIDLLYPVSDPHVALHQLQICHPNQPEIWGELERRITEEQRNKLEEEIDNTQAPTIVRKI